jgi:hypothetical protein
MTNKAVLLIFLMLAGCSDLSSDGDIRSSTYSSFAEASKKGAFELGWLPHALPKSAIEIVEVHNVDSGEIWMRFRYAGNDIQQLTQGCASDLRMQLPNERRTKRNVVWWPKTLTDRSDQRPHRQWTILSCPRMQHARSAYTAGIAVNPSSRTAWYWIAKGP